jgi:hypothetical protein
MMDSHFDTFIAHASEDKAEFVEPLASELRKQGLRVWFDKFTLKVGDSLHDSINDGLNRSRYGVVIFSPHFFSKNWPQAELRGLFSREMDGHTVILPVLHNMTIADLKAVLPIESDKVALFSSVGVELVTRSLIEVIKPELLEVDVKKSLAFEGNQSFIELARKKHPGYDFAVHSGASLRQTSNTEGHLYVRRGSNQIVITVSDPALIGEPAGGHITFIGEGVAKMLDLQRTGRPQTWNPGEFEFKGWHGPLMPSEFPEGTIFRAGPSLSHNDQAVRFFRVEVGSSPASVVSPMMEMRPVRAGTDEAEAQLSARDTPLRISIVFRPKDLSDADFTLSWKVAGHRARDCKKLIETIDALRAGDSLRLIDIELDELVFQGPKNPKTINDSFPLGFRRCVLLASQIEEKFSTTLRMPTALSEEDERSLFHFDCLLNGREYRAVSDDVSATVRFSKGEGESAALLEHFMRGGTATITDPLQDFPGYFVLFGQSVATPEWVREFECVAVIEKADLHAFMDAKPEAEFEVKVKANGPVYLRWREASLIS